MLSEDGRALVISSTLFAGFTSGELIAVLENTSEITAQTNEVILEEGKTGGTVYLLAEGKVRVEKVSQRGINVILSHIDKRGTFFGEMALIDMMPRVATVRAETPVRLVKIESTAMSELFDRDARSLATISLNIARVLSERLRQADEIITEHLAHHAS